MFGKLRILCLSFSIILGIIAIPETTNATVKDSDADGLTNQGEIDIYHTDPENPDSDSDGFSDSDEVLAGSNPLDTNSTPALTAKPETLSSPLKAYSFLLISSLAFLVCAFIGLGIYNIIRKKRQAAALIVTLPPTPQN